MAADTMVISALGRPFRLGMLYDSRKDQLIPGITLWDYGTLQKDPDETPQPSSAFEIIVSDSIEEKTSKLDVDGSLKASFMSGLIQVGGSAKYLNDQKTTKNQVRLTLQYKSTTVFKQLSMSQLGMENMRYPDIFDKGIATHVVTGIQYGAQAFFVFDSEKSDTSSDQDIQGNMKAVIKKIPNMNIKGKASLTMSDKDTAISNTFSCKFHGDFNLEANPTSFEDAVKVYQSLPNLLGVNGEKAVPQKIWLMPLKTLDSDAAQLIREISVGLVRQVQDTLEDFSQLEMRCNDALEDEVVQCFPQIAQQLKDFKAMSLDAKVNLRQDIAKTLPLIRGGEEDETVLDKVFEEIHNSLFNIKRLSKWMDCRDREINLLRACIEIMEGTKIIRSQNELDREVLNPKVKQVACFAFTSLGTTDPYLTALSDHLKSTQSGRAQDVKPQIEDEELQQWYYSTEVYSKMREKANRFNTFARANKDNKDISFVIAAIANQKHKGASIYLYQHENGFQITEDFEPPNPEDTVKARSDLLQHGCRLTLDPNTVTTRLFLSEGNSKVTAGEERSYPAHPERFSSWNQVLCVEALPGRCYWEVEWTGVVAIAVTYRGINRKGWGDDCWLGANDKSWSLECRGFRYTAWHNGKGNGIPAIYYRSSKVGVYLDWSAGILSFYKVSSSSLSHLHTFHCRFTEPLFPGFWVWGSGSSASLC